MYVCVFVSVGMCVSVLVCVCFGVFVCFVLVYVCVCVRESLLLYVIVVNDAIGIS